MNDPDLYEADPVHVFKDAIELVTLDILVILVCVIILSPFKYNVDTNEPTPSVTVDALTCKIRWYDCEI